MAEKLRDDKYEVLLKANEQDEKTRSRRDREGRDSRAGHSLLG